MQEKGKYLFSINFKKIKKVCKIVGNGSFNRVGRTFILTVTCELNYCYNNVHIHRNLLILFLL